MGLFDQLEKGGTPSFSSSGSIFNQLDSIESANRMEQQDQQESQFRQERNYIDQTQRDNDALQHQKQYDTDAAFRQEQRQTLSGRDLPIVGPLLQGLDYISSNPISESIAEYTQPDQPMLSTRMPGESFFRDDNLQGITARENFLNNSGQEAATGVSKFIGQVAAPFFVPGAELGVGSNLRTGAEILTSRLSPGLGRTVAREAAIGAPIGFGSEYAQGEGDLSQAVISGAAGAALGGAFPLVGRGLQSAGRALDQSAGRLLTGAEAKPYLGVAANDLQRNIDNYRFDKEVPAGRTADNPSYTPTDTTRFSQGFEHNLPENVTARASSAREMFLQSMRNKYDPNNQGADTLGALSRKERQTLKGFDDTLGITRSAEPPVQSASIEDVTRLSDIAPTVRGSQNMPQEVKRGNYRNQLDNGNYSPELQQRINNTDQRYDRITNAESVAKANENVKNLGKAESDFLLNQSGGPDHIATGYRLMHELDTLGEHERALVVSKKLAEDLTKSGQTSQAASILSRLSPEGQLLNLVRAAEKNGKTVSVADSIKFKELAAKVQEKSGAGLRANQFNEILNRLEKGENVGVDDIKKLSNFLSGSEKVIKPKAQNVPVKDDLPVEFKDARKRDKVISFLDDAEQAALARIKARRSQLNSLPLPEWGDHAIVVASQIAKGTIKAATHVEDLVRLFGDEIRPVASEVFHNAQKLIAGVSTRAAEGNLQKANEAFTRITGQSKETTLQEKIVEKYLKENPKVSPKDIDTLRELAKNVTRLSGDQKLDADIAMQKILNSYEKSSLWDKTLAIRYMSMLLNTSTQTINAVSGPIMSTTGAVADVLGTMVDIVISKALKQPRTTTLYGTNPLQFMARYFKNLKTGVKAGAMGVNPAGIQGSNEIRGLAFKSLYNPLGLAERGLGAIAKGPDFATYKSVFDSEMIKQARVDAINKKIKGHSDVQNHIQQFINDPPEAAILQADRIGKNTTFQRSDTTGGKLANFLNNSPNVVKPAVNAIFPFVRTPVNIASTAVTMTPAGIIKGLYQMTSKSDASRREAIRALSMGLTGTGIGALGYYLSQIGVITGANDSGDKEVDSIREQAGKGKYRFNTSAMMRYFEAMFNGEGDAAAAKAAQYQKDDKQFDYNKLQPLALSGAIGASLQENKGKPIAERIGKAGEDAFGSLFGMSTLKGVQDVFQPQYGGTVGEKALGVPSRIAESFFKSFSPGGLAQEARRQDPIVRKTPFNDGISEDVKGYFKSRTPGLSQSLPANKTTLGQSKLNALGIQGQYLNPYKSEVAPYNEAAAIISQLIDRTGDKTLAPSAPDKKVEGKDRTGKQVSIALSQDRYTKLQEDVGQGIIKGVLAIPNNLPDAKKIEKIKDIYSKVKETERNKVKRENGIRIN